MESRVRGVCSGRRWVKDKKLEHDIILTDWQPYHLLPKFINLSDICVNLFRLNRITRDIIPTKIFQYQACGKPVPAYPLPGMDHFLRDEGDGVLYANDFDDAVSTLCAMFRDRDRASHIGRNGHALVNERYSWRGIARTISEELVSVVKKGG